MHIDKKIAKAISFLDLEKISASEDVVYLIDVDMILLAYNDAWINFAMDNSGEEILNRFHLGTSILDAIIEPLCSYFTSSYQTAVRKNRPFTQNYECNSDKKFRFFRQFAYPVAGTKYLVITNHLVMERPHSQEIWEFADTFINDEGLIAQCSNCRKTRNPHNENQWYWIPDIIRLRPKNVSHTICPHCMDFYYPDLVP